MKKRILGMVLILSMLMAVVPIMASAETGTKYGDYLYYEVNSDNTAVTITDCNESASEVTIPNEIEGLPVTSIGEEAFMNCSDLINITIPEGVISIDFGAFRQCYSLTNISIPESVTYISSHVFSFCESLTNITIPNGVTGIGEYAFGCCENLTSITIPDSTTYIGKEAFYWCNSLTSITILNSVLSIESYAFFGCSDLKDVYYIGTEGQWESIKVGQDGNDRLLNATIHYNYTRTTPDTYEIGEITPTETGVTFTIQTKETVSGKQTVVVACYDGNGLFIGVKTQKITASDAVQNISVDIDKSKTSAVKAFIWNDIGYMMPASRMQSLEL